MTVELRSSTCWSTGWDSSWHERNGNLDAGIDGEIELRNPATGEVANKLLLVQSKASDRPFPGENEHGFHYLCNQSDVDQWMSADNPVLLICSHPQSGEAWWMHIQGWFADPHRRASGRIDFDKLTQRFDQHAAHRLRDLADPHGQAHTPVAEHRKEVLTTNLLHVGIPNLLYCARTKYTDPRKVTARQRDNGHPDVRHDFILRGGRVYTWLPPEETALRHIVEGPTDVVDPEEWASDIARQRWLVQLLNYALQRDVSVDCAWHSGRRIVYFRATEDMKPRSIRGATGRQRLVFNPKYKKHPADEISYCKHAALEWQFLLLESQWYCALSPTHHYTRDGIRDSLFLSDYLKGIKQLDRNPAVYGHTRMWATYLRSEEGVLNPRQTILRYGDLLTRTVERGIDDATWLAGTNGANAAEDEAEAIDDSDGLTNDDLVLFEVEP